MAAKLISGSSARARYQNIGCSMRAIHSSVATALCRGNARETPPERPLVPRWRVDAATWLQSARRDDPLRDPRETVAS